MVPAIALTTMLVSTGNIEGVRNLVMWNFKSCPRCRGDIFIDRELGGSFEQCLQCGYLRDLPDTVFIKQHNVDKENNESPRLQDYGTLVAKVNR